MMQNNLISAQHSSCSQHILLAENLDFKITPLCTYKKKANITYRSPIKMGNITVDVVATTTLDMEALVNLRVEKNDEQYCVVNDSDSQLTDPIKLIVKSEAVGYRLIQAIIDTYEKKAEQPGDFITMIDKSQIELLAPFIFIGCGVLLTISLSFWLLFK
ncbi:hypothetical protein [Zooshikella ganghwensis]|uniref:Uncharacterized protein n=1 Tax=Zooshikella ganghwensis TaxID=202772 RepID=A0A4P9VI65_9GAMM|nr:hypothetical protein [Zooshikella ganghwensis]RDH41322.1 hypothetical protein B9G39_29065 [Zooshikella ganghwensis]